MRRSSIIRTDRATVRIVQRLTADGASKSAAIYGTGGGGSVGEVDGTGEFRRYGLLDLTKLGAPFLLAP